MIPVVALGVLAVGYILARPMLAEAFPDIGIAEFPAGMLVVGLLLYGALRQPKPVAPPKPWRRHEQVVRELPDPTAAHLEEVLEGWIETGRGAEAAADVLARATAQHAGEREALRHQIARSLSDQGSRRKREALIERYLNESVKTGA